MLVPPPTPMPKRAASLRVLAAADCYSPEASGGAERAAHEVYRRLAEAGADVRVVSAALGRPHDDADVSVEVLRAPDLSGIVGGHFAPAPGAFVAMRRGLQVLAPNVIHVNTIHYTACIAGARLAERTGIPLVATVQLGPIDQHTSRLQRVAIAYERLVGGYVLDRAHRVLAVSDAARTHAIALGARPDSVSLAPNGVDHGRFAMPPISAKNDPLVVAVGRLTSNKGPDLLIEAVAKLADVPVRVRFVGDGPMRRELEARVAALGVGHAVEFVGLVDDVETHIAQAEIVVRASYTEGLSLAIIEGMASGRCNIVSDIPANRELIVHGENGLLFRVGDSSDLARALRIAIEDPQLRERLATKAQVDARPLTWDNMAAIHAVTMLEAIDESASGNARS